MKVVEVMVLGQINDRVSVLQYKRRQTNRFEITEGTRVSIEKWMQVLLMLGSEHFLARQVFRTHADLSPSLCAVRP
ncbi:hypothetical protein [uncultured Shimia sp.]|uniref:hypothetical protein n=1 Tax=uncultured Shimia sp. TaxID=573152 RepID=UPI0025CC40A8|nr:hypothetical protein [uncultured Shimia sp.]